MTEFASHETAYETVEAEPRELAWKNVTTGGHLWASATCFFFIDFLFAYFYLRSVDSGGGWRPNGVDPSLTLGTFFTAALVGAAFATRVGLRHQRAGRRRQWRRAGATALALLVAALGLQIAEWAVQDFGPTQGGYASVFVGWTGFLFLFVLGTTYWVETVLATAIRYRNVPEGAMPPPGHASGDPHRTAPDIDDPLSLVRPQLTAVSVYLDVLGIIAVISWIVLYLL